MEFTEILQAISTVGFPILCALVMGYYVKYISDKNREDIKELNTQHNEEMMSFKSDMVKALNNNTQAMIKLCAKLGVDDIDIGGLKDE